MITTFPVLYDSPFLSSTLSSFEDVCRLSRPHPTSFFRISVFHYGGVALNTIVMVSGASVLFLTVVNLQLLLGSLEPRAVICP